MQKTSKYNGNSKSKNQMIVSTSIQKKRLEFVDSFYCSDKEKSSSQRTLEHLNTSSFLNYFSSRR